MQLLCMKAALLWVRDGTRPYEVPSNIISSMVSWYSKSLEKHGFSYFYPLFFLFLWRVFTALHICSLIPWNNKTFLNVTDHDAKWRKWQLMICGAVWVKVTIIFLPTPMVKNNLFSMLLSCTQKEWSDTFFILQTDNKRSSWSRIQESGRKYF